MQIEKALRDLPNTRSAFAERTAGGYFLDFTVKREAAARYGLTVGDVNDVVESRHRRQEHHDHRRRAASAIRSTCVMPAISARTSTRSNACSSRRRPVRRCRSDLLADIRYKTGPPSMRE